MTLRVNEIFFSIQGESLYCGRPCIFVRLAGCNLRCSYCDTRYAYDQGQKMKIDQIVESVSRYPCSLVEITGGEPLFQYDTPRLIQELVENGYAVLLETNGSYDISNVDPRCIKIVDIKCPSSGEKDRNDLENLNRLTSQDQLKLVIGNRQDYDYAKDIVKRLPVAFPGDHILFSPVSGGMSPATVAQWILDDGLDVRLHLQLHRVIWPHISRGV